MVVQGEVDLHTFQAAAGDVILVPLFQTRVQLTGAVARPMKPASRTTVRI